MHVAIKMPFVENVTEIWDWDSLSAGTQFFTAFLLTEGPILSAGIIKAQHLLKKQFTLVKNFFSILYTTNELSITFS